MSTKNAISVSMLEKPTPLYKQVKDMVLTVIKDKKLQAGEMLPAEPALCNMLEVSSITVRRALRELGQDGWICRKPGIGTLVTSKVNAPPRILVCFRWEVNETAYYAQSLIETFNSVKDKNCDLQIISGSAEYESLYREHKADGMIIVAPRINQYPMLQKMKDAGMRFVVLGASSANLDLDFVDCDHAQAAFIAVEYFIRHEHKNIGLLNGSKNNYDCQSIAAGYLAAMKKNKLPVEPVFMKHIESAQIAEKKHLSAVQEWLAARMTGKNKITALLCSGHLLTTDVYISSNAGIMKIPEDISVITLDETPVNMALSPPVTTVKQPLKEMALETLNGIKAMIKNHQHKLTRTLSPELIIRNSVKKI